MNSDTDTDSDDEPMDINELNKSITLFTKKTEGIHFTSLVDAYDITMDIYHTFSIHTSNPIRILEPCIGSGRIVDAFLKKYENQSICVHALDTSPSIVDFMIKSPLYQSIDFQKKSIIEYYSSWDKNKYDMILGDLPYYWVLKHNIPQQFRTGEKMNIMEMFIHMGIEMLNENGIIAYIMPIDILTHSQFYDIRKKLTQYHIHIKPCRGTPLGQSVKRKYIRMTIQPHKPFSREHCPIILVGDDIYFSLPSVYPKLMKFSHKKTLRELGFHIYTGRFIWEKFPEYIIEEKDTFNEKEAIQKKDKYIILYDTDIRNNSIHWNPSNHVRRYLVHSKCTRVRRVLQDIHTPRIVVTRGYSASTRYDFTLVDKPIVIDNQLLVITETSQPKYTLRELMVHLSHPDVREFIQLCFDTTPIGPKEFYNLVPLDEKKE